MSQPKITYTIRKNEWGEYTVRFRSGGIRTPEWDYETNDMEDAKVTAEDIKRRMSEEKVT